MLAATSMAGAPLFLGFIAKEQLYDAVLHELAWPAVMLAVGASALIGAAGLIAGVSPFAGRPTTLAGTHEAPPSLWSGPLLLAVIGLIGGVAPAILESPLTLATGAIVPGAERRCHAATSGVLTPAARSLRHSSRMTSKGRSWMASPNAV